jgi:hypothetical protein
MIEVDKAKTTIPESPAESFLRQVDRRDKLMRYAEVAILLGLVLFNVFVAARLQQVIDENQRSAYNS